MTHASNKQHLPPARSAEEYEREIATLKARLSLLRGTLRLIRSRLGGSSWLLEADIRNLVDRPDRL